MSDVATLIAFYKSQVENNPGYALDGLIALEEANQYPIEKNKAIRIVIQEVKSAINTQALLDWLEANEIPESTWQDYSYINGVVLYNGQEVELDGV